MVTTAKEACSQVCLLAMVNSCGSPIDTCRPGECSAWEWEDAFEEGGERTGHCALAGKPSARSPRGITRTLLYLP
jgi:hypothetical protein